MAMMVMEECDSYEGCLNDPLRDVDMEERCRQCVEFSEKLINNPEITDEPDADFFLGDYPVVIRVAGDIEIRTASGPVHASIEDIETLLGLMKAKKG
ncbi:MAG: hypothetical protein L3J03_11130 [Desulfobacterales bacterium]|nr:hypothetical protein [Desulfobacterales bacterium]